MDDLAPDITRQRLLIEGFFALPVDGAVIRDFFARITGALSLRTYDAPIIFASVGEGRVENEGYDAFVRAGRFRKRCRTRPLSRYRSNAEF